MMVARFMASMMMHINVEKDVRNGIAMMKYVCNHHDHFTNVYPSFAIGFLLMTCSLIVEINVMLILSSLPDILGVIMKYVSLSAIANIPRFYYNSLVEHKALSFGGLKLPIKKFRHEQPLQGAHWTVYVMRLIYKTCRMFFCSLSFYFMPFAAIFLNVQFMVLYTDKTSSG
jgi:hypothetical protein